MIQLDFRSRVKTSDILGVNGATSLSNGIIWAVSTVIWNARTRGRPRTRWRASRTIWDFWKPWSVPRSRRTADLTTLPLWKWTETRIYEGRIQSAMLKCRRELPPTQ